jgi:hypothetical protein
MNKDSIEQALDADLRLSLQAMRRAALRAHEVAARTGTAVIVSRHGVIERIVPEPQPPTLRVQEPPAPYGDGT